MLLVHLVFTAIAFVILTPLFGLLGQALLHLSGQPALTDEDIAWFFLSPAGLAALVLFVALLGAVYAFELAVLIRIAAAAIHDYPLSARAACRIVARIPLELFRFALRLVVRVLLLAAPFAGVAAAVAWLLITEHDINFYLAESPPEFVASVIAIVVIATAMVVLLTRKAADWSLALQLIEFEQVSPSRCFGESTRLVRGSGRPVMASLIAWAIGSALLAMAVFWLIDVIGFNVVPLAGDSVALLLPLLGALAVIWMVASFLVSGAALGTFSCLLARLYEEHRPGELARIIAAANSADGPVPAVFTRSRMAWLGIFGVGVAGALGIWLINDVRITAEVEVIAHRGGALHAPENSMSAVQLAIEDRADWIEVDVQESADGEVMVVHDRDFMKLAGIATRVAEATAQEIRAIDIGSRFDAAFAGERVPTLAEVLAASRDKARVIVELKYYGDEQQLEQRVVDIIEQAGMEDTTAIMSLKLQGLEVIRDLRPAWITGYLSATAVGDLARLDADFFAIAVRLASMNLIRRLNQADKQVYAWTVNDPLTALRMISLGIDGIITDDPRMVREVIIEAADLSTVERLLVQAAVVFGPSYQRNR